MTRNANLNQKMRDERREKILHHALKLFASKGLYATKVSDIATRAEMSQGLLYHYFPSKEDIFTAIIRTAFTKMNEAARQLEALALPPREKIRMAMVNLLRGLEENEDFASTVLLIAQAGASDATPAEAQAVLKQQSSIPYDIIERIVRAGQRDGTIKQHDARELSLVFWTTIKGLALHKAVYGTAFKAPDADILTSIFFTDEGHAEGKS